jgi:pyroglutamyl-peptidase
MPVDSMRKLLQPQKRVLVTGFGPFPRVAHNPSAIIAERAANAPVWRRRGWQVDALVLETTYAALDTALVPALRSGGYDAVLMLGVAPRRKAITPETVARNRVSRLFPDAAGRTGSADLRLDPDSKAMMLRSHAPLRAMVRTMRADGLEARLSRDAGRYLCNAAYFTALRETGGNGNRHVAFIHVPFPRPNFKCGNGIRPLKTERAAFLRKDNSRRPAIGKGMPVKRRPDLRELLKAINDCIFILAHGRVST